MSTMVTPLLSTTPFSQVQELDALRKRQTRLVFITVATVFSTIGGEVGILLGLPAIGATVDTTYWSFMGTLGLGATITAILVGFKSSNQKAIEQFKARMSTESTGI